MKGRGSVDFRGVDVHALGDQGSDSGSVVVLDRVDQAKVAGEQQPNEKEGLHSGQYIPVNRSISMVKAGLKTRTTPDL